jgi:hypothetical protein
MAYEPKQHYYHLEMRTEDNRPIRATVNADNQIEANEYYKNHYKHLTLKGMTRIDGIVKGKGG